jgi:hypothetical protein
MLVEAATCDTRPSVLALGRRLGLSNATFWRHFRDIATQVRLGASAGMAPVGGEDLCPDRSKELAGQNATLRRGRDRLADQPWLPSGIYGWRSTTPSYAANWTQPAVSPVSTRPRNIRTDVTIWSFAAPRPPKAH